MKKLSEKSFNRMSQFLEFNYPKPGEEEQYTNTNMDIVPAIKTENDKLIQKAKAVLKLVNDYQSMLGPNSGQIITVLQNFIDEATINSSDLESYYNSLSENTENP